MIMRNLLKKGGDNKKRYYLKIAQITQIAQIGRIWKYIYITVARSLLKFNT
jgi:hypothetical protein